MAESRRFLVAKEDKAVHGGNLAHVIIEAASNLAKDFRNQVYGRLPVLMSAILAQATSDEDRLKKKQRIKKVMANDGTVLTSSPN